MGELKIDKTQKVAIFLVFMMLFASYPFVFDRLLPLPDKNIFYLIGACGLFLLANAFASISKVPIPIGICIFLQMTVWAFYYVIHGDPAYISRIFFLIIVFVSIGGICYCNVVKYTIKYYNLILAVQAIGAFVALVLVMVGALAPIYTTTNVDGRYLYFLGVSCSNTFYGSLVRPSGFFDEPGALAFWGVFALVFNKMYFDNKRIEYILIIGLLSTLSVAYFIQLAIYFFLFYTKNIKHNIPIIIVVLISCLYVNSLGQGNVIYDNTFGRFELNEEGQIKSSRYHLMELAKDEFQKHPTIGVGASNMEALDYMGDNPYENLATDGIVGTFAIYLPMLLCLYLCRRNKYYFFSLFVISLGYLQRPFHVNMMHYMVMYLFVLFIYEIKDYASK